MPQEGEPDPEVEPDPQVEPDPAGPVQDTFETALVSAAARAGVRGQLTAREKASAAQIRQTYCRDKDGVVSSQQAMLDGHDRYQQTMKFWSDAVTRGDRTEAAEISRYASLAWGAYIATGETGCP